MIGGGKVWGGNYYIWVNIGLITDSSQKQCKLKCNGMTSSYCYKKKTQCQFGITYSVEVYFKNERRTFSDKS